MFTDLYFNKSELLFYKKKQYRKLQFRNSECQFKLVIDFCENKYKFTYLKSN